MLFLFGLHFTVTTDVLHFMAFLLKFWTDSLVSHLNKLKQFLSLTV